MKTLDITSFKNAITSLNSILERYKKDNFDIDIRDAVIQRFEYTYSLAIKMMTKFIYLQSPEYADTMTFNQIIRSANQLNILQNDLTVWTNYRQKRNMTSHVYNENVAKEVVEIIPQFKEEAEFLLNKLQELL